MTVVNINKYNLESGIKEIISNVDKQISEIEGYMLEECERIEDLLVLKAKRYELLKINCRLKKEIEKC